MGQCWLFQMPPTPKAVLMSLADNANDHGYCWPSLTTICERTCFGRTAVIDAIKWLETVGALKADRSDRYRTTYVITPDQFTGVVLVRDTNQSGRRTSSVRGELVREADNEVRETDDEVRQADPNRKEPSVTVNNSNRKKRTPALPDLATFDFSSWPNEPSVQVFADWLALRKQKRAPVTATVMTTMGEQLRQATELGFTVDEALKVCVHRGWQGLNAEWLVRKPGVTNEANRQNPRESLAELAERLCREGDAREHAAGEGIGNAG